MARSPNPTHATPAPEEVIIDATLRAVPPMICPQSQGGCGRGMTPRVERWRKPDATGIQCADVQCMLCGRRFVYTPAVVRAKQGD